MAVTGYVVFTDKTEVWLSFNGTNRRAYRISGKHPEQLQPRRSTHQRRSFLLRCQHVYDQYVSQRQYYC